MHITSYETFPRPSFFSFLGLIVSELFPDTVHPERGFVYNRFPGQMEKLCNDAQQEAYADGMHRDYSMLQAISQTLQNEYEDILHHICTYKKDNADTQEQIQKRINQFTPYFSKVYPTDLPRNAAAFQATLRQYMNGSKGWTKWLNTNKPKGHLPDLLRILVYGILHPRSKNGHTEQPEERNARIGRLYQQLLTKYLGAELPHQRDLDNHFHFTWEDHADSPITMTEGTKSFLRTMLCLFNLLVYSDGENGNWSSDEVVILEQLLIRNRKSVDVDNHYVSSFYETQSYQVFLAQPYASDYDRAHFRTQATLHPEILPDFSNYFSSSAHIMIHAPAASGKTTLYKALGKALTRNTVPVDKRTSENLLAQQFGLDEYTDWLVIALNAQQYIWYWSNYGATQCEDFVDMFFRGNLIHSGTPDGIVDTVMSTTIPERLQQAYHNRRLVFLFDGFDELCDADMQYSFRKALDKFTQDYPAAHRLLFTRPVIPGVHSWLSLYFPDNYPLPHLTSEQLIESDLITPEMKLRFQADRYHNAITEPLLLLLLCRRLEPSLADAAIKWVHQVIVKEYDAIERKILLPPNIGKQDLRLHLEQLAWHCCLNRSASIAKELARIIGLPTPNPRDLRSIRTYEQDIHKLASQSGVLIYCRDSDDFTFLNIHVQTVLAASYLSRQLHRNADPMILRSTLYQLPDDIYQHIAFWLIHIHAQPDPLLSEILTIDFLCRNWNKRYMESAALDIAAMKDGSYGPTPFHTSKLHTLHHLHDLTQTVAEPSL